MNDPTYILEKSRRWNDAKGRRNIVAATARRSACALTLVLFLLTTGFGGMPELGSGVRGLALQSANKPAQADTLAGTDQQQVDDGGNYGDLLSVRTRHKTH